MKAILCNDFGPIENLSLESVDAPQFDPDIDNNSVMVEVIAAGLNFPDALVVQGKYQIKPPVPFIPGMELCGTITKKGSNVTGLEVGNRVIASSDKFGAFAEQIAIPANQAIKIPQSIEPTAACNLLIAHGTAHHALKQRANIKNGETLVVLGAAGGTGLAAVQIGKAMGAKVIAAASSPEKLQLAKDNGADVTINYSPANMSDTNIKDAIREHTNGRGADVIYDPVGGELFDASVRAMAPNGRFLVIGFASGQIPKFPINLALVKEISLVGVFWGAFVKRESEKFNDNMRELISWYESGKVSVEIDKIFTLAETKEALAYVMSRQVKGKVAITVGQESLQQLAT